MSGTAASVEEQAELQELRDRADRTTAEAARTIAELTGRLAQARQPGVLARRLTTNARNGAAHVLRGGPGKLAGQRGARRAALAAIPVLALVAAVALARRQGYVPSWPVPSRPAAARRRLGFLTPGNA